VQQTKPERTRRGTRRKEGFALLVDAQKKQADHVDLKTIARDTVQVAFVHSNLNELSARNEEPLNKLYQTRVSYANRAAKRTKAKQRQKVNSGRRNELQISVMAEYGSSLKWEKKMRFNESKWTRIVLAGNANDVKAASGRAEVEGEE
jgi:hypothetical protein